MGRLMVQILRRRCKPVTLHADLWPLHPVDGLMLSLE